MKIEEKLSFFRDCIIDDVDSEILEKKAKLVKEASEKLSLYQKRAKDKFEVMIETENQSTLETKRQMYSRAQIKKREQILRHKNGIMNAIIDDIRKKLSDFVGSEEYVGFIDARIEELLPEISDVKHLEISFLKDRFDEDKELFYELFSELDAEITLSKFTREKIGGLIVVDKDHEILYDLSLDAVLDSNIDEIGMTIYEEFDRQVNYES